MIQTSFSHRNKCKTEWLYSWSAQIYNHHGLFLFSSAFHSCQHFLYYFEMNTLLLATQPTCSTEPWFLLCPENSSSVSCGWLAFR